MSLEHHLESRQDDISNFQNLKYEVSKIDDLEFP